MSDLSPEAKAEIAAAVAIVRQDKVHAYIRRSSQAATPPVTPPTDPPPPANPPPATPPPATPPATPPAVTPPPPKPADPPPAPPAPERSRYWGEIIRDEKGNVQ